MKCGRCGVKVNADTCEVCWYCHGALCVECWEEQGHCGHEEAEELNRLASRVMQYNSIQGHQSVEHSVTSVRGAGAETIRGLLPQEGDSSRVH